VRLRSRFAATVAAARDMTAKYDAVNLFRLELVGAKTQLKAPSPKAIMRMPATRRRCFAEHEAVAQEDLTDMCSGVTSRSGHRFESQQLHGVGRSKR
jgi:hypothetical protein